MNKTLTICDDCGHQTTEYMDICEKCDSKNIYKEGEQDGESNDSDN